MNETVNHQKYGLAFATLLIFAGLILVRWSPDWSIRNEEMGKWYLFVAFIFIVFFLSLNLIRSWKK